MNAREFAERSLIGTLLSEPGRVLDLQFLNAEDFANPMHQVLFRTVDELVNEAADRVDYSTATIQAPDNSGPMELPSQAEQAFRFVRLELQELVQHEQEALQGASWDVDAERRRVAERAATDMSRYPGVLEGLPTEARETLERILPMATTNPWQVPGVDPIAVFERIQASGELGTQQTDGPRAINAPNLHTLMATAPPNPQHRTYALMVVEASMRRQVEQTGMRVGQAVEESSDLSRVLAAVETALDQVAAVQARWEQVTETGSGPDRGRLAAVLAPLGEPENREDRIAALAQVDGTVLMEVPTAEQVQAAENAVLHNTMTDRTALPALVDRLIPEDFVDRAAGNTFRIAVELHQNGQHVDPVTIAWAQQSHVAEHGNGLNPDALLELSQAPASDETAYAADVVMRGSLARITQHAADTVRAAAQQPGLQPGDVLHTTRTAYEAVTAAARRMNGRGSDSALLAGLSSPKTVQQALVEQRNEQVKTPVASSRSQQVPVKDSNAER